MNQMSCRNVWLNFSEWELISQELSHLAYHPFQLESYEIEEWKKMEPNSPHCFRRVPFYEMENNARAMNILCREHWRNNDTWSVMRSPYSFIGFILTHFDNMSMDTTYDEWEIIRNDMLKYIDQSGITYWHVTELLDLYKKKYQ